MEINGWQKRKEDKVVDKTITFSFNSNNYEGIEATETFTFEKLGIDENMDDEAFKIEIDKFFRLGFGINLIFLSV